MTGKLSAIMISYHAYQPFSTRKLHQKPRPSLAPFKTDLAGCWLLEELQPAVSAKATSNFVNISSWLTFEVEENIGSIVFEHLSDKLNIHIPDVNLLAK